MHPLESLLNGSLATAVEMLAKRAAFRTNNPSTAVEKRAVQASDFLSSIGTAVQNHPIAAQALLGGVAGAGLSSAGTAIGNVGKPKEERKSLLRSALTGGLAGTGMGAGVGVAREGLAGIADGRAARVHNQPGTFTHGGQQYQLRPGVVNQHPELNQQVQELSEPSGVSGHLGAGILGGLRSLHAAAPVMGSLLPAVGAVDAGLHAPGIGMARMRPENATGDMGRDLLSRGLAGTTGSALPEPIRQAIAGNTSSANVAVLDQPSSSSRGATDELTQRRFSTRTPNMPSWLRRLTGGRGQPNRPEDLVMEVSSPRTVDVRQDIVDSSGNRTTTTDQQPHPTEPVRRDTLSRDARARLMREGQQANPDYANRNLYRLPGTNRNYRGAASGRNAALGRLAMYGGLPFGEYMLNTYGAERSRQQNMEQIIGRLREQNLIQPVGGQ